MKSYSRFLKYPMIILPAKTHDTTLISTAPLSLAAQQDQPKPACTLTVLDFPGQSCAFCCQSHNTRWKERERQKWCMQRVCESDWSVRWVIALGFASLQVSKWVYLALVSWYYSGLFEINNKH